MQNHLNMLSQKKLSYNQTQHLIEQVDLERVSKQHDSLNQEITRLKIELSRYKALHEETGQKTSYMKETINQLVGEIEKLNDIITSQDDQIHSLNKKLEHVIQQCDEQKSEKSQLLKFLQQYQNEHQSSRTNEQALEVISRSEHIEKELISIKSSYEQLKTCHQREIEHLKAELDSRNEQQDQRRVHSAIEKLEQQLVMMGNLLDQKQEEIEKLKQPHGPEMESYIEDLQGQVQHFKELHRKTQNEFNQYKHNVAQKDTSYFQQEKDQQMLALKKQISFLEDQNSMLRQTHEDTQINALLKDLSLLKSENQKMKERMLKVNQLELQIVEMAQELKKCRDREGALQHQLREASPAKLDISDDRISGLLNVVQSLQLKNEQLQQYLSTDYSSPFRGNVQPPTTVTLRKEALNPRIHSEQPIGYSPTRQMFHRSTPNVNLRVHQFSVGE